MIYAFISMAPHKFTSTCEKFPSWFHKLNVCRCVKNTFRLIRDYKMRGNFLSSVISLKRKRLSRRIERRSVFKYSEKVRPAYLTNIPCLMSAISVTISPVTHLSDKNHARLFLINKQEYLLIHIKISHLVQAIFEFKISVNSQDSPWIRLEFVFGNLDTKIIIMQKITSVLYPLQIFQLFGSSGL